MKVLRTLGKLLISMGVGVLLFVAWTLWGTGISTSMAQDDLESEFEGISPIEVTSRSGDLDGIEVDPSFKPRPGDPVFRIVIPKLDERHMVVEGVGTEELRKGPGHYPNCRRGFRMRSGRARSAGSFSPAIARRMERSSERSTSSRKATQSGWKRNGEISPMRSRAVRSFSQTHVISQHRQARSPSLCLQRATHAFPPSNGSSFRPS
jgi:hypothetical protein